VVDGNRMSVSSSRGSGEKEPQELLPLDIERLRRELQKNQPAP